MSKGYFERVQAQTPTRFWINNVTREQAQLAIDNGAVGCTQNPSYTWKMLTHETEKVYAEQLLEKILKTEKDDNVALVYLQRELIGGIAKIFNMPMVIVDESHNEILREEELYFNLKDKSSVTEMLRRGEITKLRTVAMDSVNYPLKVELYTNQAGTIALYRVYHFIPYTYEPVTDFEIYRE